MDLSNYDTTSSPQVLLGDDISDSSTEEKDNNA